MKTIIIYSDELKNYDFGEGHPFKKRDQVLKYHLFLI
jgi:hypothetical protein